MTSLVQLGHGFDQTLGIGPSLAHGLGEGDSIGVEALDSLGTGMFSDLSEALFEVLRRAEYLFATGALPPVAFEQFATCRADIRRERLRPLVFVLDAQRDLGLLNVILIEEVGVGDFQRARALGVAEKHLDGVGIQVVIPLEDSGAVVPEVVRVDGLVNARLVRQRREHLVGRPLCPVASLVGFPVRAVGDEEPVVVSGVLPVVLDIVPDVLRRAEHRPLPAADGRPLQSTVGVVILLVEKEVSFLGIHVADFQRDQRRNALTGEDQQFEEGTITDGEPGVAGGIAERPHFVFGEHVRLVVLGRTVALVDDDTLGVDTEVVVPEERLARTLVMDHPTLGFAFVVVHGVHAVVELGGSGVQQVNAGFGSDLETPQVVLDGAGLQRLQIAVPVEVLVPDGIFIEGVTERQERVTAGVSDGSLVGKRLNATKLSFEAVAGCVGHGYQSEPSDYWPRNSTFSAQSQRRTVAIPLCERAEGTPYSAGKPSVSAGTAPSAVDPSQGVAA